MIRGTAPFLLTSVLIQAVLGIFNKRHYGGQLTYALHSIYVPIIMLALVFLHATFGLFSIVSRSKYRESSAVQLIVILSMVIVFVLLVALLVVWV